jgi:protein-S-isoprenylcysteine O-methyltransferase Ste14
MEVTRYWVGAAMVAFGPVSIVFWFSIHPFIAFWRRVGAKTTLAIHITAMVLIGGTLMSFHAVLMRGDLGTSYVLAGIGGALLIVSAVMRYFQNKATPNAILTGLPELDPIGHESTLVVWGPYVRIRHPRYVQLVISFSSYALFANYATCYIALALTILGVRMVIAFEERELIARFGDAYRRYMETTPRFVPRLGR